MAIDSAMLGKTESLQISMGGTSVCGPKPINQDAFAAYQPKEQHLRHLKGVCLAIADGLSSGKQSQEASQMAVVEFIDEYYATSVTQSVKACAGKVLNGLNAWLFAQNNTNRFRELDVDDGLVTTFTAAIIKGRTAYICHAGDSRAYVFRNNNLHQISNDHVRRYSGQWVLTKALGIEKHVDIDYYEEELTEHDVLLLSTDGLHGVFPGNALAEALTATLEQFPDDLEACSKSLVEQAIELGADDNVSCLLGRIESLPLESLDDAHKRLSSLRIPPALTTGVKIDDFEILRVMHNSTRSHVYLVKQLSSGQTMVLKTPSPNFADDTVYLEAFVREHWLGRQLDNPHIIKHFERPKDSQFLYSLSEYVEGQTLREWMIDNPKPRLESVRLMLESLVTGLRAMQRDGIVHRDIKPENIMIDQHNRCKIIDLGAAIAPGLSELASAVIEDAPMGDADYIAPEYLLGSAATVQSDLYSLGCMIYEMLCGALPYQLELSPTKVPKSLNEWDYRSIRKQRPEIPIWVDVALQTATAANPNQRYAAYSEFLQDMRKPGEVAIKRERAAPLIERYPQKVWQGISALLAIIIAVQAYIISQSP